MIKKLNIDTWARKDHFYFFKQFEEPYFGVCVEVDCSLAIKHSKETGYSFFLYYLHKSLVAANTIEAFRYRIQNDEVLIYDKINASPTINRYNGTFGFAYIEYKEDLQQFIAGAQKEIDRVKTSEGLKPASSGQNVIHYSVLPGIRFTSLSHARAFSFQDSCPKISFGKIDGMADQKTMPVSIHVHHALLDGFHVSQFIDLFQELMNIKPG